MRVPLPLRGRRMLIRRVASDSPRAVYLSAFERPHDAQNWYGWGCARGSGWTKEIARGMSMQDCVANADNESAGCRRRLLASSLICMCEASKSVARECSIHVPRHLRFGTRRPNARERGRPETYRRPLGPYVRMRWGCSVEQCAEWIKRVSDRVFPGWQLPATSNRK